MKKKTGSIVRPRKGGPAPQAASDASVGARLRKKEKIGREIAGELYRLRSMTREIIAQAEIRLGAEIADLIRIFESEAVAGEKHLLPPAQSEIQLIGRIRELKTKPPKGRIKDLTRISRLLADIRAVIDEPYAKTSRKK